MKINIYIIDKKSKNDLYTPLIDHYLRSAKRFADINIYEIFGKDISKANDTSPKMAKVQYSKVLDKYLAGGYNVVLDPSSKEVDSYEFSELLKDRGVVNFFIGGAYGFERDFLLKSNKAISFGKITLSHKLIKVVLMEQIFRGLSILNNHPYHK
ncbi:MAG: 23S rRNA (pseudouridine(1915)-N(3))-methyltransferase RlmH [Sulfurovum sp.]|nr:23S rRNA (pseudouridine(1915)-N(3))-methyltransferase RlmH [Sulfurovum sp.]